MPLRPPSAADAEPCGRVLYEAFRDIAERHGFPPDFDNLEQATFLTGLLIGSPACFSVVAEEGGRIVGSNFMMRGDAIQGIGPISVDTACQGRGFGRQLMQAAIEQGQKAPGIRLTQDGFNMQSLSLYASLGFDVKEPLAMLRGRPRSSPLSGNRTVRPLQPADLEGCNELCRKIHGVDRANELRHAQPPAEPWVVVRDGRISAYATGLGFWAVTHGVAETEEDMRALILAFAAAHSDPVWFLLPMRQAGLFRWCLSEGLRVIKPMNLMALRDYGTRDGACWFPSVWY